ncbi:MAG TPA: GAF domain-containing protein [Candidatus Polarisedimenticolia bacterium]|nr:GAF domain-containing protein [Candidatus Polarisedimenticolia bacterium]
MRGVMQMRAFYRISRLGSDALVPEEAGRRVAAKFCQALGLTGAEIWLLGPARRRLWRLGAYGEGATEKRPASVRIKDDPFARLLLRRRDAVYAPADRRDLTGSAWSAGPGPVLGVPLAARGRVFGLLYACHGGRPFGMSARDLELASALAHVIGEVLHDALGHQKEAKRRRRMILLNRVHQAISSEDRETLLLPRLARILRREARCHAVLLGLYEEEAKGLKVVAAAGPGANRLVGRLYAVRRDRRDLCPGGRAVLTQRPVLVEDLHTLLGSLSHWREVRSILAIPIRRDERVIGALRLEAREPFAFDDEDIKLFSIAGTEIGQAILRMRTLEELSRRQSELRAVSRNLEEMLEEDRRRIARELHDELAQSMSVAKLNLGHLQAMTQGSPAEVGRTLRDTAALLDRTIAETHRISMDLRPATLDQLGLLPALRWFAADFSRRTGIQARVQADGAGARIRHEFETLLYRFFQEALTNVARHSGARRAVLSLTGDGGQLRAVAWDDGRGMASGRKPRHGLGLLGMRERIERAGGVLRIESRPGKGTRVMAEIPLLLPAGREARAMRRPVARAAVGETTSGGFP